MWAVLLGIVMSIWLVIIGWMLWQLHKHGDQKWL